LFGLTSEIIVDNVEGIGWAIYVLLDVDVAFAESDILFHEFFVNVFTSHLNKLVARIKNVELLLKPIIVVDWSQFISWIVLSCLFL
jgi:hypothetical protein